MNKIIAILPNSFEDKREFKDLRKEIINNYRIDNIIDLPRHTFQPYVEVGTIILNLTINQPSTYFWKFKIQNDGYTQNKRREKKEGENDFDIFWKFKDQSEVEKLKNGFQKLELEEIKKNNYEFHIIPDFSKIWETTPEEKRAMRVKKYERTRESILHFAESIKLQADYLIDLIKEEQKLTEYFKNETD